MWSKVWEVEVGGVGGSEEKGEGGVMEVDGFVGEWLLLLEVPGIVLRVKDFLSGFRRIDEGGWEGEELAGSGRIRTITLSGVSIWRRESTRVGKIQSNSKFK